MRKKPYTKIGISRLKCFRCKNKANQQWQICSDDRIFRPLCIDCDIKLNGIVLKWAGFKNWKKKLLNYKKSLTPAS